MAEIAWWIVERGVTLLLVLLSVPLLLAAVIAQLAHADALGRQLFLLGAGAWGAGIAWGVLVNRGGPALARV